MSDPFSVLANVTSVLDISIRCATSFYKLIQELQYVPEELHALSNEASDLGAVLLEVESAFKDVGNTSALQQTQKTLKLYLDKAREKLTELDTLIASFDFALSPKRTTIDKLSWLRSITTTKKLQEGFREVRQNIHLLLGTVIA